MKKVFTISVVFVMFILLFTAQNTLAQKDPFKIGKEIAMTGKFSSSVWLKKTGNFGVTYNSEFNAVAFQENPESGNGLVVWWVKELGLNTYSKFTFNINNNVVDQETAQDVSITKEIAEQEAWKILEYFGCSK
jgi:hypothetical protein